MKNSVMFMTLKIHAMTLLPMYHTVICLFNKNKEEKPTETHKIIIN